MVNKVEKIFDVQNTRTYNKKNIRKSTVNTDLALILENKYSLEDFSRIINSWDNQKLHNEIQYAVFSLNLEKLDMLRNLLKLRNIPFPRWLCKK